MYFAQGDALNSLSDAKRGQPLLPFTHVGWKRCAPLREASESGSTTGHTTPPPTQAERMLPPHGGRMSHRCRQGDGPGASLSTEPGDGMGCGGGGVGCSGRGVGCGGGGSSGGRGRGDNSSGGSDGEDKSSRLVNTGTNVSLVEGR